MTIILVSTTEERMDDGSGSLYSKDSVVEKWLSSWPVSLVSFPRRDSLSDGPSDCWVPCSDVLVWPCCSVDDVAVLEMVGVAVPAESSSSLALRYITWATLFGGLPGENITKLSSTNGRQKGRDCETQNKTVQTTAQSREIFSKTRSAWDGIREGRQDCEQACRIEKWTSINERREQPRAVCVSKKRPFPFGLVHLHTQRRKHSCLAGRAAGCVIQTRFILFRAQNMNLRRMNRRRMAIAITITKYKLHVFKLYFPSSNIIQKLSQHMPPATRLFLSFTHKRARTRSYNAWYVCCMCAMRVCVCVWFLFFVFCFFFCLFVGGCKGMGVSWHSCWVTQSFTDILKSQWERDGVLCH